MQYWYFVSSWHFVQNTIYAVLLGFFLDLALWYPLCISRIHSVVIQCCDILCVFPECILLWSSVVISSVYFQNTLRCDPVLWYPLCISRMHYAVIQCCDFLCVFPEYTPLSSSVVILLNLGGSVYDVWGLVIKFNLTVGSSLHHW